LKSKGFVIFLHIPDIPLMIFYNNFFKTPIIIRAVNM